MKESFSEREETMEDFAHKTMIPCFFVLIFGPIVGYLLIEWAVEKAKTPLSRSSYEETLQKGKQGATGECL